ncbi:MAG: hypothetical protein RR576_04280 [Oscillospiraceae bacterium]
MRRRSFTKPHVFMLAFSAILFVLGNVIPILRSHSPAVITAIVAEALLYLLIVYFAKFPDATNLITSKKYQSALLDNKELADKMEIRQANFLCAILLFFAALVFVYSLWYK